MIEVNLLPGGKKRPPKARRRTKTAAVRRGLSVDRWILGGGVAALFAAGYVGYQFVWVGERMETLTLEVEEAARDSAKAGEVITTVEGLRARRDSIAQKVELLQQIDGDRYVWAHVMDEVARALPDYTWLTGLFQLTTDGGPRFQLVGRSGNNFALTRFMENLEASAFLRNVTLVSTEQVVETGMRGVERLVSSFVLEASYEDPPSEILEMVPLFQPDGGTL